MLASVCHGVGHGGRTEQCNPHHVVVDVMAIFAVVQETDAVVSLAQVHPFMGAGFEACPIPACIAMRWSLNVAPLDFVGRLRSQNIHRERDLEHGMTLIPVDVCSKVESG